mmetsp:Transcript_14678/g.29343  ORF Transcript_14678/g.29343 Transcript_14678/m.29343 type:complete len:543 (+) Transcript_14678:97-1725(+)
MPRIVRFIVLLSLSGRATLSIPADTTSDLKVLHWVHVPKAGGTSLTKLLKKVVCKINPMIEASNPCCRANLCLHASQCHGSTGGCPLVTAVGRHSSNMALAKAVPCCSTDLAMGITSSFMHYALPQLRLVDEDLFAKASLTQWPLRDRVAFLLSTGVSRGKLFEHLEKKKYGAQLLGGNVATLLNAAQPLVGSAFSTTGSWRDRRLAACSTLTRVTNQSHVGFEGEIPRACARLSFSNLANKTMTEPTAKLGDFSLSIVRHPFARALSGCLYKGHNPNYDVFDLRPGLWLHPSVKPRGYHNFNFYDYVVAPEYQNSLVKMFGYSRGCAEAHRCDKAAALEDGQGRVGRDRRTSACTMANQCHGYRNATTLDERHLETANRILARFRFVGLQEAYNSSVLLLARTFDMEDRLQVSDFAKVRHTPAEEIRNCKGYRRRAVGSDAVVCREVMRANHLDVQLYEMIHRNFCRRLELHGLRGHPMVESELTAGSLCSTLDFSDSEAFCSHFFETPEALALRKADRKKCVTQVVSMGKFRGPFPEWGF